MAGRHLFFIGGIATATVDFPCSIEREKKEKMLKGTYAKQDVQLIIGLASVFFRISFCKRVG